MPTNKRAGQTGARISGLRIWRDIDETTFISAKDPELGVQFEIIIEATDPASLEVDLLVTPSGDIEGFRRIGGPTEPRRYRVGAKAPTDIGCGIMVTVGQRRGQSGVTGAGAALVLDADKAVWDIERKEVLVERLLGMMREGKIKIASFPAKPRG